MAKRFHGGPEYYAGRDERRAQERADYGMLSEDHSSFANMPQNVVMREYPQPGNYLPEDLDDTIAGIDRQMREDNNRRRAQNVPRKV